jgi:hypothetical protein
MNSADEVVFIWLSASDESHSRARACALFAGLLSV